MHDRYDRNRKVSKILTSDWGASLVSPQVHSSYFALVPDLLSYRAFSVK